MRRFAASVVALALVVVAAPTLADTDWDGRQEIKLSPVERNYLLDEMQSNMTALQEVYEALAAPYFAHAAEAATTRGMDTFGDKDPRRPKTLTPKLPPGWKALSAAGRNGFDELAKLLKDGEGPGAVMASLGRLHANCHACHVAFKLTATPPAP